ncbi:unnamed protein product [Echinostoma caproni]|uniref:Ion_trans domain-containing protein n=1 Tax=Echinostoma caproni TaxID=27848 RepID=A0A183A528_9TREM|nr:unnamed protein product [Echinostoma caproni]
MPEYKIQQFPKPKSVLLHYGIFRIVWDWILLVFTFYIAFMVPYYVTFGRRVVHNDTRKRIVDLVVEVLLIVDIVVNFNTTYVNKNGQLVHDRRQLAVHYIRSWFVIDALAALPVDFMLTVVQTIWSGDMERSSGFVWSKGLLDSVNGTGEEQVDLTNYHSVPGWNVVTLLQVMKLAKLLRLARLFENLARLSQHSIVVLSLLMFTFTLVAHWFACIWYVIGESDHSEAGWLQELARRLNFTYRWNQTEPPNDAARYFTALYFTCSSLTSVGFGNVSANTTEEKIFAICIMLLGALMHAAVFGNVTAIIQRIYARRTAFQSRAQDLKDFVRVHHIPKQLKRRMEDFFQTTWAINRGIDLTEVLSIYPEELRRDIALHLNRELLSMKTIRSRCDVKSLTYCDLQSIELVVLNEVLAQYPQFKSEFAAYLYEDLSFNIEEGAQFMDSDAVLVPAITLQLTQDNSSSPNTTASTKRASNFDHRAHGSNQLERIKKDLVQMEAGFLSTREKYESPGQVRASDVFPTARSASTSSSVSSASCSPLPSDMDGMRFYPRRPTTTDGNRNRSKRGEKRRATFSDLFTVLPSPRNWVTIERMDITNAFSSYNITFNRCQAI